MYTSVVSIHCFIIFLTMNLFENHFKSIDLKVNKNYIKWHKYNIYYNYDD